jgi:hypothetical protein
MMSASELTTTVPPAIPARRVYSPAAQKSTFRGDAVIAGLRAIAPYAAMLLVPGGSLMALLLWFYRRRMSGAFVSGR